MKKFMLLLLGISYYFMIQINVMDVKHSSDISSLFSFTLNSYIPQTVKLHVGAKKYEFYSIRCNKEKTSFPLQGLQWFEGAGEQAAFSLRRGKNHCQVITRNNSHSFIPIIKQKLTFFDYAVFFVLIGMPLLQLLFTALIWILNKMKNRITVPTLDIDRQDDIQVRLPILLFSILLMGTALRILYFQKFGIMNFQHDWQGHVEFIRYMANNWTLPLPSKGLQFPQQPLYYVVSGAIYVVGIKFGLSNISALYAVGYFSLFCSVVFLYYSYKFIAILTVNRWTQTVAMLFVSLTPSLVYLSARINNDSLVMVLSAVALYYIVKSYQTRFKVSFYSALVWTSLLFLTKISASPIELLLFALLIMVYLHTYEKMELNALRKKLYIFSVLGLFLLGFTLLKNYLPIENTFYMVNSSSSFPGQEIHELNLSYFTSFHPQILIESAYEHIYGLEAIHNSFASWQYRTMLFGESDYVRFLKNTPYLKETMQAILLFGFLYIVGFLSFILQMNKVSMLHKFLFMTLVLNLLLIVKFVYTYTSTCNTDFRYYVPVFTIFAFIFAQGLEQISHNRWIRYILNSVLGLLVVSEVLFFMLIL